MDAGERVVWLDNKVHWISLATEISVAGDFH